MLSSLVTWNNEHKVGSSGKRKIWTNHKSSQICKQSNIVIWNKCIGGWNVLFITRLPWWPLRSNNRKLFSLGQVLNALISNTIFQWWLPWVVAVGLVASGACTRSNHYCKTTALSSEPQYHIWWGSWRHKIWKNMEIVAKRHITRPPHPNPDSEWAI